jgi:hypothetical protein
MVANDNTPLSAKSTDTKTRSPTRRNPAVEAEHGDPASQESTHDQEERDGELRSTRTLRAARAYDLDLKSCQFPKAPQHRESLCGVALRRSWVGVLRVGVSDLLFAGQASSVIVVR